jgi:hypothetical protein
VKEHAPYEVKAKKMARATVDRVEGEVRGAITKLKKQLNSSNIYNSTMAPAAASGGMTASELGRAITKANQEEKATLLPTPVKRFRPYKPKHSAAGEKIRPLAKKFGRTHYLFIETVLQRILAKNRSKKCQSIC